MTHAQPSPHGASSRTPAVDSDAIERAAQALSSRDNINWDTAPAEDHEWYRTSARAALLVFQNADRDDPLPPGVPAPTMDRQSLTEKVHAIVHHSHGTDHAVESLVSWLVTGPLRNSVVDA